MTDHVTAAHRRDLIVTARATVAKILAADTTRVGANVLAQDALEALDEALTVDEQLCQPEEAGQS